MIDVLAKIGAVIAAAIISVSGFIHPVQAPEPVGASIPKAIAVFETSLASKITASDTSMTLVSGTDKAGNSISGYIGFVIDEGSADEEFVAGNASGTAVSSLIRGIDPVDGNLEVTALKKAHRRGASVKVTTYPVVNILARVLNGDETIPNALSYSSASSTFITDAAHLASKAYVDAVAIAGASDADESTKGIVEAATQAEIAAGNATGTTGALLFPPTQYFNTTSSATTTVPVTNSSGKLSQGFLNLAEPWTFAATTTLASTTQVSGTLNVSSTANFSGTTNFTGTVTGTFPLGLVDASSTDVTVANSATETTLASTTIPANTLSTNNAVRATYNIKNIRNNNPASDTITYRLKYGGSTFATWVTSYPSGGTFYRGQITAEVLANASTSVQEGLGKIWIHFVDSSSPTLGATSTQNQIWSATSTALAIDSTLAKDLVLTAQHNTSSASLTTSLDSYIVERLTR